MKRIFLVALLVALLGSCSETQSTDQYLHQKFKQHSRLFDPSSAMFRNLTRKTTRTSTIWCGEINAKNRYGAYVGWTKFEMYVRANGTIDINIDSLEKPAKPGVNGPMDRLYANLDLRRAQLKRDKICGFTAAPKEVVLTR